MKNKISKKAERLINDFEIDIETLSYNMYSEYVDGTPEKDQKKRDSSYNKLITYIADLESKLKDYRKATIKDN